jgi:hypothetical protein
MFSYFSSVSESYFILYNIYHVCMNLCFSFLYDLAALLAVFQKKAKTGLRKHPSENGTFLRPSPYMLRSGVVIN